ncbi:hypothetical protein MLD52_17190 [Puniceicoccaceae bacterium K14]|nr:hypothetical protein [Puniceicoccaceae bacterium K14]
MKKKRSTEIFSLSFLDCICCGFGAIILLFVISMGVQTRRIDDLNDVLETMIQQRIAKLNEYQLATEDLKLSISMFETETAKKKDEIEELDAMIAELKQQILNNSSSKDKYLVDIEQLKKEVAAMQKEADVEQVVIKPSPVGVPVDSTHIAFVIDTSGSMRDESSNLVRRYVVQKFQESLEAYPQVDGIQLLDASGHFIVGRTMASKWIEDTPENRMLLLRAIRLYPRNSDSNPVPGIVRAIRLLHDPENDDMKMGIYVFGDEFTGKSDPVLRTMLQINKDKKGERISRINAVGFPNVISPGVTLGLSQSGLKFANLMRELTFAHGGAFIALQREGFRDEERPLPGVPNIPQQPRAQPRVVWPY